VAKLAAHGTALQEGDKTDARAIDCAHGFKGMDATNEWRGSAHDEERIRRIAVELKERARHPRPGLSAAMSVLR
jgi:hypothetical protein